MHGGIGLPRWSAKPGPRGLPVRFRGTPLMDLTDDHETVHRVLRELEEEYEEVGEKTDDFLFENDANMKRLALSNIRDDVRELL